MPELKRRRKSPTCNFCKKPVEKIQKRACFERIFCDVICKELSKAKETDVSTVPPDMGAEKAIRPCLGWCGKSFLTTKSIRTCPACVSRREWVSLGIEEQTHDINEILN